MLWCIYRICRNVIIPHLEQLKVSLRNVAEVTEYLHLRKCGQDKCFCDTHEETELYPSSGSAYPVLINLVIRGDALNFLNRFDLMRDCAKECSSGKT